MVPVDPNDPDGAADQLTAWADDLEHKAGQYRELHDRMASLSVTETSRDGIAVTVDGEGIPTDIRFADSVRGIDPAALSAELMRTLQRAQVRMREQIAATVHETVGDDEAGANIIDRYAERFPDPEEPAPDFGPDADGSPLRPPGGQ
jgi:hypothetical protein